jgi:CHRD domain-containing protein
MRGVTRATMWSLRASRARRKTIARRRLPVAAAALMAGLWSLAFLSAAAPSAQNTVTFKARLSPVPINVSMMSTIAGSGSLTATLQGKQLTIQGTFEGLRSPATTVQIHRGPKGIRGPVVANLAELTVTKALKGVVSGTLELTPDQIADLRSGRWYLQIQSERAPDGNLWGWLLQ